MNEISFPQQIKSAYQSLEVVQQLAGKAPASLKVELREALAPLAATLEQLQSTEEVLRESEARYRALFDDSPVALWEEDFSEVKLQFERLRAAGITDFKAYFDDHPQFVRELISKIKVLDVNESALTLYEAQDKTTLLGSLKARDPEEIPQFACEFSKLAAGETFFETTGWTRTQQGKSLELIIRWSVPPGYEETLARVIVSVIDITARKQAEEGLRKSEERFRTLFETAAVGIISVVGRDGKLAECNPAFQKMLGYSERELRQMTLIEVTAPDDCESSMAVYKELRTGKRDHVLMEKRYRRKDGRDMWAFISAVAQRNSNGDWLNNYAIVQDISQRKLAEEALVYQANLLQNVSDAIIATDLELRITSWNKAAEKIYGWHEDEVIGRNIDAVCQTEFLDETREEAQKRFSDEGQWRGKVRQEHKNGTEIFVMISVSWLKDDNGNPIGGVTVNRDITDHIAIQRALLESEARLEGIIGTATDAIVTVDEEQRIILFNAAAEQMFGYQADEVMGEPLELLIPERFRDAHSRHLHHFGQFGVTARKMGIPGEVQGRRADGQEFPIEVMISQVEVSGHRLSTSILRDVTERKRMELQQAQLFEEISQKREQLRALTGRLVETEEAERKAIARELHDQVGQTLTGLDLNLNVIKEQISGALPQANASIQTHLDDSLALVEQIGTRIRDIMAELRPSVLDDYGLLAALHWYRSQLTSRANFAIVIQGDEPAPRLPAPVELALFRITQEALTNVARHAQAGQVTVSLASDNGTVRLIIADDGLGFEIEDRNNLSGRQSWGLLTMAERAEAVGGHCRVESHPSQGTQVIVEIQHVQDGKQ
jgi:PAS domain S-box-containing protein